MTMQTRQATPLDVRKFDFDDFDGEELQTAEADAAPIEVVYSQSDMNAARQAADTEGYARGVADTDAAIEGDISRLLARIVADTQVVLAEQAAQREQIGAEAVRLAALIARKTLPALAEAGALQEIEALIKRCLSERPEEPRLVIRVHDEMLDRIQAKLNGIRADTGFAGKPILLADPAIRSSEIRIEWANGGVDWNFDNQLADIEAASRRLARPVKPKTAATHNMQAAHDDSPISDEIEDFTQTAEILDGPASTTEIQESKI